MFFVVGNILRSHGDYKLLLLSYSLLLGLLIEQGHFSSVSVCVSTDVSGGQRHQILLGAVVTGALSTGN